MTLHICLALALVYAKPGHLHVQAMHVKLWLPKQAPCTLSPRMMCGSHIQHTEQWIVAVQEWRSLEECICYGKHLTKWGYTIVGHLGMGTTSQVFK